jgi:predicted Fe-S protein YdhL (DUF1289 family)
METPATNSLALRMAEAKACAQQLPSPCISVCTMVQATGLCAGCLRTLDEIAAWSRLDDTAKRQVWQRIEQRLAATATV